MRGLLPESEESDDNISMRTAVCTNRPHIGGLRGPTVWDSLG